MHPVERRFIDSPVKWLRKLGATVLASIAIHCQANEPASNASPRQPESKQPSVSIEQFVRQLHVHGVPYDEASAYGREAAPRLLEMLRDVKEEEHWSTIVVTLCIVADADVFASIRDFIGENGSQVLSRSKYAAKTDAITALGYLVYRTGSEEAADYLIEGLEASVWRDRVRWKSPYHKTAEALEVQLAQMSVMALSLSGRNEALHELEKLKSEADQGQVAMEISNLLDDAIETNKMVQQRGLAEYLKSRVELR